MNTLSKILIFSHGFSALHWKLATTSEVRVPVVDWKVISDNWNCEELQFPTALPNVVHWDMA